MSEKSLKSNKTVKSAISTKIKHESIYEEESKLETIKKSK